MIVLFANPIYAERHSEHNVTKPINVLVVGLDNVESNYFPKTMITEETGIPTDSIGDTYNSVIINNIVGLNKDKNISFVAAPNIKFVNTLFKNATIKGEDEEKYVDIATVPKQSYKQLLEESDSDYILFLNQHYIKRQEKPLITLFHFVSFSLFDKSLNEVTKGNNYFTSMKLPDSKKLPAVSRKCSSKIVSTVVKRIDNIE